MSVPIPFAHGTAAEAGPIAHAWRVPWSQVAHVLPARDVRIQVAA